MEEEPGDFLEDSWFFGNLLNTKPKSISRCYSDIASLLPTHSQPDPLKSTLQHVESSFSSRKQPSSAPNLSLIRTPSLPNSIETQYSNSLVKKSSPGPHLMSFVAGVDKEDVVVKKERKSSSFTSRKQPPVAPPRLTLTRISSLPALTETESFITKKSNPNPNLTRASSKSTYASDQEDDDDEEEDEDQESEFTLGRLIRQASMNYSQTSNPTRQSTKTVTVNVQKKLEVNQEKVRDTRKVERNRSKSTKIRGTGTVAPAIPGGLVDKTSSEDMKAHIKFWARAVASNVRQECS